MKKTKDYFEEDLNNKYPSSVLLDPTEPASADFQSFFLRDVIDWDISGAGIKLGGLYRMENNINLGAAIKLPTLWTIKETYSITSRSIFGTGQRFDYSPSEERFEYEISTPAEFSLGASFNRNNMTFSGNVTLIDYSKMEFKGGFDYNDALDRNTVIVEMMRSVANLNAGIEYMLPDSKIALRGGFMFMPSPFKDDPSEFNKKFVTAGVGYNFSHTSSVNVAYVYGWWKDVGDNYGINTSRTFQDIKFQNFVTSFRFNL
jgi:long-subunit fatty acid transport protein